MLFLKLFLISLFLVSGSVSYGGDMIKMPSQKDLMSIDFESPDNVIESDSEGEFFCQVGVLVLRGQQFYRNVFRGRGDSFFNARRDSFDLYHSWISQNRFYSSNFNHFFVINNCFSS